MSDKITCHFTQFFASDVTISIWPRQGVRSLNLGRRSMRTLPSFENSPNTHRLKLDQERQSTRTLFSRTVPAPMDRRLTLVVNQCEKEKKRKKSIVHGSPLSIRSCTIFEVQQLWTRSITFRLHSANVLLILAKELRNALTFLERLVDACFTLQCPNLCFLWVFFTLLLLFLYT